MSSPGAETRVSLLTTDEAAEYLNLSPNTLRTWRCRRSDGPSYVKLGARVVRYRDIDLEKWMKNNTH
ncbi:helix-turn-helix transcriptional regulator [Gimibacter soli]|uniref:helix-turn-helix transcriptional regulator n=1 Tax=Gimibacter soli TaxID=3024400 RepID=UPI003365A597